MITSFISKLVLQSMSFLTFLLPPGTCLWEQSEVQGRQVHYRARPHDQGQRLGLSERPGESNGWMVNVWVNEWLWFAITLLNPLLPSISCWHTPLTGPESGEQDTRGALCVWRRARACVCMCVCVRHGTWEHTEIHECIHKVYRHTCVKTTAYRMSRSSQPDGLYYKWLYSYTHMT